MARIEIVAYSPIFDGQVRALCQLPVSGNISLALEREPDYYTGAAIQCNEPEVYICLQKPDHRVYGVFNLGLRKVYYQEDEVFIRYLCDLRIHPDVQGSSLLFRIIRFADGLNLTPNGLPAQTIVFGDNRRMLDMIVRSRVSKSKNRLPGYHYAGNYVSHLIGFHQPYSVSDAYKIRCATESDVPAMQEFVDIEGRKINYFPVYKMDKLNSKYYYGIHISNYFLAFIDNRLVGICGIWDQSSFKQTRITGYSTMFSIVKPVYNLYKKLLGGNTLPIAGSIVKYLNLHTVLVEGRSPDIFKSLVQEVLTRYQSATYDYLLCGLDDSDPLTTALKSFKQRREVVGRYFLVNHEPDVSTSFYKPWFYLEAARI
jgi:hypothetical protein